MSTELKVNITNLPLPNSTQQMSTEEIRDPETNKTALDSMNYAATFWTEHFEAVKHTKLTRSALDTQGQVTAFLRSKLLVVGVSKLTSIQHCKGSPGVFCSATAAEVDAPR